MRNVKLKIKTEKLITNKNPAEIIFMSAFLKGKHYRL